MPDHNLYSVHLFAVVRFKLEHVAADSPETAIDTARCHALTDRWLRRLDDPQGVGEFADEFSHYLVDVSGDPEFEQSRWFCAMESPLLEVLRRLVRWNEQGRDPHILQTLLEDVRTILFDSI